MWALLGSLLFAGVLAAQTNTSSAVPSDDLLGEIVVTGSRLPVVAGASAPLVVLERRDIERSGADSIGKVLQSLPSNTGSPRSTNVNNNEEGGDGSVRVDLRGLGAERTLVLLNGRRFPNGGIGGDASVDLNTIPVSWIERIEVLASGASAVYGADAVGGVVNVITRHDIEGMEFAGSGTVTGQGDGEIVRGNAAAGFGLFADSWNLGIDYVKQDGVTLDRRGYSAIPLNMVDANGTREFFGSGAIPEGRFGVPAGNALGLAPGNYTRVTGATGQTAADYRPRTSADQFNFAPFNFSQTPNERSSAWLLGSLPVTESARFSLEGLFHHRESTQEQAPTPISVHFGDAPTLADGTPGIPAANYYNPFGVDIGTLGRRLVEQPKREFSQNVDLWRAVAAIEGEVLEWNWKLALGKAESETANREIGLVLRSRLLPALGPSGPDDSGRIVCGPRDPATGLVAAGDAIAGCVPLDLFGGAGSITPEQLAYVSAPLLNSGSNEQEIAEVVLSGHRERILGRELQWVLGAEYRRESGSLVGDPLRAEGVAGVAQDLPGGAFSARELFAELQIPLLADGAATRRLLLNLGTRWSDFSSFDENTSWQAGLHWQPAGEIALRASYAEVFRAPSLLELFQSRAIVIAPGFDPCGNSPSPAQQVNCAANGVPGGSYVQADDLMPTIVGGNPDLDPETGRSVVASVTWSPPWAPAVSIELGLFDIELDQFIGSADLDEALLQCAEHGAAEVCNTISRFADGRVSRVSLEGRNFGHVETRGADMTVAFQRTTDSGDVSAQLLATYLARWDEQPFPNGEVFHRAGQLKLTDFPSALPRWRASGYVDWRRGPWVASYAAEYVGSFTECIDEIGLCRPVESTLFHDVAGGLEFETGLALRAAINNVTDQDPPFVDNSSLGNTDVATYRLLGRTYYLELRYAFQ